MTTLAAQKSLRGARLLRAAPSPTCSVRVYVSGELRRSHASVRTLRLASPLGATRPALTGIGVASLATPDTLIEIEAVARVTAVAAPEAEPP